MSLVGQRRQPGAARPVAHHPVEHVEEGPRPAHDLADGAAVSAGAGHGTANLGAEAGAEVVGAVEAQATDAASYPPRDQAVLAAQRLTHRGPIEGELAQVLVPAPGGAAQVLRPGRIAHPGMALAHVVEHDVEEERDAARLAGRDQRREAMLAAEVLVDLVERAGVVLVVGRRAHDGRQVQGLGEAGDVLQVLRDAKQRAPLQIEPARRLVGRGAEGPAIGGFLAGALGLRRHRATRRVAIDEHLVHHRWQHGRERWR